MGSPGELSERTALAPDRAGGTVLGKRYEEPGIGLEVMCIHAGDGSLTSGETPLGFKSAKPLPTSD
jgi:hypothetical protein